MRVMLGISICKVTLSRLGREYREMLLIVVLHKHKMVCNLHLSKVRKEAVGKIFFTISFSKWTMTSESLLEENLKNKERLQTRRSNSTKVPTKVPRNLCREHRLIGLARTS